MKKLRESMDDVQNVFDNFKRAINQKVVFTWIK